MLPTRAYATHSPTDALKPFSFERRELGAHDVLIETFIAEFVIRTSTKPETNGKTPLT